MNSEARAAFALAHLLQTEADEVLYRWPPASTEEKREAAAHEALGRAAYRRGLRALGLRWATGDDEAAYAANAEAWQRWRQWWLSV